MNVFRKLWLAIENVASALNCLAVTIDAFSVEVRQRAGIPAEAGPPLIPSNGEAEPAELPPARKRRS